MTRRVGSVLLIEPEPPRECSECGIERECRPYGKDGAQMCFDCAMATPESKRVADEAIARRIR
jgi:hypothetical protein